MDYKKTAQDIIHLVGGTENVQNVFHCMTRLRFNLHQPNKVEREKLEHVTGVMGIHISGDQFQVIIGTDVSEVYNAIVSFRSK